MLRACAQVGARPGQSVLFLVECPERRWGKSRWTQAVALRGGGFGWKHAGPQAGCPVCIQS